ncbi:acyl-CoA synthetase (AMP-forming)/AMP-acid ligase II [Frondihabitans sp. PhB188]|uniref:class I adenylate-forming enzyme family protein n=1 Tax=Frondihabitans sp. PhB188 TaxID=2485200 RepID=UPI000F4743BE|nr:AMP-binding protein [Frondihabitans sp. PhB188]ROQ38196.1 acyl-CoA synthetase (AMP-forming)/AMP-acid ligase II [Frondihabitans sp. PhB188]
MDTLASLIRSRAAETPSSTYLEDARSERTVTFGDLGRLVGEWAAAFNADSVSPGATVVLDVADPLSFAVAHLSVVASGRRGVPVNPGGTWGEILKAVGLGSCEAIVTDRAEPGEADVVLIRPDAATLAPAGSPAAASEPLTTAESPGSVILFTSGSTGQPKGVELDEQQLLFVARAIAEHNGLTAADRGFSSLPLFHVNAEVVGLLSTLVAGATLVLDQRFHRTGFWELLAERRITWLNAVPAILAVLAKSGPAVPPEGLRFVRSASSALPEAVRTAFAGIPMIVSYGMTEGASQITATPLGQEPRPGSVGLPVGDEVQPRDADGAALPAGEIGELWIRGPGVVTAYFEGRAADRFDDDGWLRTGDLGHLDDDGWVYLAGRTDDVINRGGEKVYPAEVEDVLLEDARVREAVVVARPDPILGSVPVAYVIPADLELPGDVRASLVADLTTRCDAELPRFKRPLEITVVDDLPRTPTGKVQRNRTRDMVAGTSNA